MHRTVVTCEGVEIWVEWERSVVAEIGADRARCRGEGGVDVACAMQATCGYTPSVIRALRASVLPVVVWTGFELAACVGSDPEAVLPETGQDSGLATDGASDAIVPAADAGTSGCSGRPFDDLSPITVVTTNIEAGAAKVSAIRRIGTLAYMNVEAGGSQRLYRGTFTPGTGSSGPTVVVDGPLMPNSHPDEADSSATLPDDSSFLVFAHGAVGGRRIWSARSNPTGNPMPFYDGATVGALLGTFNGDDAEPWLAGSPTRALYWGRANVVGAPFRIVRSTVSPVPGDEPRFADPSLLGMTCPGGADQSCAVPVVTPDERTMLFVSTPAASFEPRIYETALETVNGVVAATGDAVSHEALGFRYPSWISKDGCEAIFGGADHVYARRR